MSEKGSQMERGPTVCAHQLDQAFIAVEHLLYHGCFAAHTSREDVQCRAVLSENGSDFGLSVVDREGQRTNALFVGG